MEAKVTHIPLSDFQLWEQMKEGSEWALGKLIHLYFNMLLNYGCKFVEDEAFVKDCVQDIFIEIWTRRKSISQPQHIKSYLLKSVRQRVLRQAFRQKVRQHESYTNLENDPDFAIPSHEGDLVALESQQELTHKVAHLLAQLPKRQREVIYLRFYQALERDEIAEVMNVNPQSVSNFLQVAYQNFRQKWKDFPQIIPLWLWYALFDKKLF